MISRRRYLAHRLAWLHFYGEWPARKLDHGDLDKDNNRIANLRQATRSQNHANRAAQRNNALGIKGVCPYFSKFRAQITKDRRKIYLGLFDTPDEARRAYAKAAADLHGEFARAS